MTIGVAIIYCCMETEYNLINVNLLTDSQIERLKNYQGNYIYEDIDFELTVEKDITKEDFLRCEIQLYHTIC
jgi:hypothetical protein